MPESKKSSGCRKHGRASRSPAHIRYNNEDRGRRNKERRIAKEAKRQARLKARGCGKESVSASTSQR